MRLIRITTNYSSYLTQFYNKYPELVNQPYQIQYQKMVSDCFGWADFWTNSLGKIGYEVWEPIANAEPMQKIWAKEHHVPYNEQNWLTDITKAQVKSFNSDILFVDDYNSFKKEFILQLRTECPSIKLVLGWCGAPYSDASIFSAYDIVLSNIPELITNFQALGHQAQYFRHAFEPQILNLINTTDEPFIDCSFIGSIMPGKQAHNQRIILLKALLQKSNIEIFSDVYRPTQKNKILNYIKENLYNSVQLVAKIKPGKKILQQIPKIKNYINIYHDHSLPIQLDPMIVKMANLPLFGIEMFQGLYNSKITFNNHIDISQNSASNMRLFEATGVGTCLLTDWKNNLPELFEPDKEVVTYKSVEECIEKLQWLLNNPQQRKAIAQAGQVRTLKDHTFTQRAIQLDEIIKRQL
jgi:hypothetical protein